MQKAIVADQAVIHDAETVDVTYVDNQEETPEEKKAELKQAQSNGTAAKIDLP
jgi:hypothetical protein